MRLSLIVPVLNSHEIVRRQFKHFDKMDLSDDVEIILVDDGSDPPILETLMEFSSEPEVLCLSAHLSVSIIETNDSRPWTWALARNKGARIAKGEYLLMFDLDYIISEDAIKSCLEFEGEYRGFRREFGVLDKDGNFIQTVDELVKWGWPAQRYAERGFQLPPHPNDFLIRKDKFFEMGMYREDLVEKKYPQGEDRHFKGTRMQWEKDGKLDCDWKTRPTLYMFPNGQFCGDVDYNPFGMFHDLTRKTTENPWYKKQHERTEHNHYSA
jgi:glycosyltransferase involved in cell wall biosynthesis